MRNFEKTSGLKFFLIKELAFLNKEVYKQK